MDAQQLTKAQLDFYDFIYEFTKEHRRKPLYREIKEHFDYKSDNSVTRKLKKLVDKGYLTYEDGSYLFTDKRPGLEANVKSKPEEG